ncbi:MAG: hypothetical protein HDT38_01580 [Clostridiales bacterium]|nr:hypothetical protein [Clostridiales bacterium]
MRKLLLFMVAAMSTVLLMSTTAFAAPLVNSATERPPEVDIDDPDVPLGDLTGENGDTDIDDPSIPLGDLPGEDVEIDDPETPLGDLPGYGVEIDDPDVPLSGGVLSPKTGVTGLTGTECMALLAAAFAVGGGAMLAKARKQAR